MTRAMRVMAVGVALAMGAVVGAGCGAGSCSLTPPLTNAPSSCTLAPNTTVDVNVRWCNCGSSVVCDVTFQGGSYFLEPRVTACDAECPGDPTSCGLDTSVVTCAVPTPALGADNTYGVDIADATGTRSATFTIAAGGSFSCGP